MDCSSQDDPGMVEVSRESQDTHIGGGGGEGVSSVHPRMIKGWSNYPENPRILRHREVSFVRPEMILGWLEYPGNSEILRQGT